MLLLKYYEFMTGKTAQSIIDKQHSNVVAFSEHTRQLNEAHGRKCRDLVLFCDWSNAGHFPSSA